MEHLYEPIEELKKLKKKLNNHGRMVIEVPNAENYTGIRNIHIGHLFHFTPKTIFLICQKVGLVVEKIYKNFDRKFSMAVITKKIS